jgi:hypothetical protein
MPKAKRVLLIAGMMPMCRLIKRQAWQIGMGRKAVEKSRVSKVNFVFIRL